MSWLRKTCWALLAATGAGSLAFGQVATPGAAPASGSTATPSVAAGSSALVDPFAPQAADGSLSTQGVRIAPINTTANTTAAPAQPAAADANVQPASATMTRMQRLPKIGHMPVADERIERTAAQPLPLEGQFEHVVHTFDPQAAMGPSPGPQPYVPPYPGEKLWDDYKENNVRWWTNIEYLRWRVRGYDTPPLVTQSPAGTPLNQAGRLGQPTTEVLFGGNRAAEEDRDGGRIRLGWWSVDGQFVGWQGEYFGFLTSETDFTVTSPSTGAIIARPFFNTALGQEDAALISGPGLTLGGFTYDVDGFINVHTQSELHNVGVIRRHVLWADFDRNFRIDWLIGYRYMRLDEELTVTDIVTLNNPSGGVVPAGTQIRRIDQFGSTNDFHAGEFGLMYEVHRGRLSIEGLTKMAIGNVHESLASVGSTAVNIGGVTGFLDTPGVGGLLVQPGLNDQNRGRNELGLLTESELKFSYQINDNWRVMVGCTIVYLNRVVRPGQQIDTNLNPTYFPPVTNPVGAPAPNSKFVESYLWMYGLTTGVEVRW